MEEVRRQNTSLGFHSQQIDSMNENSESGCECSMCQAARLSNLKRDAKKGVTELCMLVTMLAELTCSIKNNDGSACGAVAKPSLRFHCCCCRLRVDMPSISNGST